jgi:hypothetical protein
MQLELCRTVLMSSCVNVLSSQSGGLSNVYIFLPANVLSSNLVEIGSASAGVL